MARPQYSAQRNRHQKLLVECLKKADQPFFSVCLSSITFCWTIIGAETNLTAPVFVFASPRVKRCLHISEKSGRTNLECPWSTVLVPPKCCTCSCQIIKTMFGTEVV